MFSNNLRCVEVVTSRGVVAYRGIVVAGVKNFENQYASQAVGMQSEWLLVFYVHVGDRANNKIYFCIMIFPHGVVVVAGSLGNEMGKSVQLPQLGSQSTGSLCLHDNAMDIKPLLSGVLLKAPQSLKESLMYKLRKDQYAC
ncbi:hypothetical protein [Corynebacterium kutscheri]|uniref:hypothetical protein n=1 Tax=Corynebacterium kutscheri TaxID=35755 RepID=UPI0037C0F67E